MLEFNDTSTIAGHFVSSPRERERKDRRNSRGEEIVEEMKERDREIRGTGMIGRKRRNKNFPP